MNRKTIALVGILFFLALIVRFSLYYYNLPQYQSGQKISFSSVLQQDPNLAYGRQQLTMRLPSGQAINIQTTSNYIYSYGDALIISGILEKRSSLSGQNLLIMYYPKITLRSDRIFGFIWPAARRIREKSSQLYLKTLPPVSASLLMGIVFGIKEPYPRDFLQDLRTVGVLHVIAASGMNVSFIAGMMLFSLGSFLNRRISLFLTILVVIFYTFIVGFQASILRASIMAILAFTAKILGRQSLAVFTIFTTAFALLYWQPSLLFDVSFQLSFLSTIGILMIKPLLDSGVEKFIHWKGLAFVSGDIMTTTAAQIGTLPVMLGTFGNYGLLSIFVNAVVLWTIPILMMTGSLAVLFGFIFEPFGQIFLWASYPFLLFFQLVVVFFGGSGLLLSLQNVPLAIWIGYYCFIAALTWVFQIKRRTAQKVALQDELTHT